MASNADNAYPNVAPMHVILQDALDDLSSARTSTATKGDALVAIEHVLAETADPRAEGLSAYFNALQDTFQCNIASRLIMWAMDASSILDACLSKDNAGDKNDADINTLSAQLTLAMTIIQGVALVHKASKQFLGRRYPLEALLNLLLVSRRLTHSPNGPSVPTSPKAGAFSAPVYKSQEIPLASVVLDTLLCVLVDSIPSLRVFEDLNGVQVVVKILKRSGTPREVRMKCLEFIYFYLMDETTPPETVAETASSIEGYNVSPRPPSTTLREPSAGFTTRPSSRSSSGSSMFSTISTSTNATSTSLHEPSPSKNTHAIEASFSARPPVKTVIPGFTPSSRAVTPPAGGPSAIGRGQPRSLLMLKKEVDYVPQSPKKPVLSHLGRGPSGLRPKAPAERERERTQTPTTTSTLAPRTGSRPPSHDALSSSSTTDTDGEGRKATVVSRAPRPRASLAHGHARGLSVSSVSSVSSLESTSAPSDTTSTPTFRPAARRTRTPLETPRPSPPASSTSTPAHAHAAKQLMHRRAQSCADIAVESPLKPAPGGPRSASSPSAAAPPKSGPRTMAEKKEILGTMLGNVDALVEGVKKAGVWGLN